MRSRLLPYKLSLVAWLVTASSCAQNTKLQVLPVPNSYGLWTVDISADDKFIALGGDDSLLQVLHADLSPYQFFPQKAMVRSVNWHPKKNLLAIATMKNAWLMNLETGKEIQLEGSFAGSRAIRWNNTGSLLGMADGAGVFSIWDEHGKLLRQIQKTNPDKTPDKKSFLGFDWHPFNNTFVTIGDEIRIYDTSGNELQNFKHRAIRAGLLSVKWHPSGEFFVAGDYGHEKEGIPTLLQFWKADGTLIREIMDSHSEYRSLNWNREGTRLATGSDALRIRDKEGKVLYTGDNAGIVVWGVDWTKNSDKIVTVNFNGYAKENKGRIRLWSAKGELLRSVQ